MAQQAPFQLAALIGTPGFINAVCEMLTGDAHPESTCQKQVLWINNVPGFHSNSA